jgi:hypothetical protein
MIMTNTPQESTTTPSEPEALQHFHLAYARVKPRLDAFPPDKVARVPLDAALVVQTALGTLPQIERLRDAIQHECPRVNIQLLSELKEVAYALGHLETLKRGSKGLIVDASVSDAVVRMRGIRDVFLADIQPLVARGKLDERAIALTPGNSARNVAFDVLRLVNYLDEQWSTIAGKTLTTQADLEAARVSARDLITVLGVRDNTEGDEELNLARAKALSWLMDVWEELRWAVRYVRRHANDADTIMPSLYSLRGKRSSGAAPEEVADAEPPAPSAEVDADLEAIMNGNWPAAAAETAAGTAPAQPAQPARPAQAQTTNPTPTR